MSDLKMDRTLKSLSLILSYPTLELQQAMPSLADVLANDKRLPGELRLRLVELTKTLGNQDIYLAEETYVSLFDRSRTLSLNLFEHVHGESRDRGSAMVSLLETYRAGGFEPATTELPDHLPLLLEFLSLQPPQAAKEILADAAHIVAAIFERLKRRGSDYAVVFEALTALSNARVDNVKLQELLAMSDDDPGNLEELDKVWEEAEVRFGPDPDAGCPSVRDMLAKMAEPVNQSSDKTAAE